MSELSSTPIKYSKLVCDLKDNILHDVNLLINDKFESLINETTDDNYLEELNSINLIIKQFPIFKKMEYEYKKLLEEIIVLKEHI